MMRTDGGFQLDLSDLLENALFAEIQPLHISAPKAPISGVALVASFDAIRQVRPDTIVVLTPEMGSRGWVASAALRHAWERRVSALIVATGASSNSVVRLAQRLQITLLATPHDPAGLALDIAAALGAARAVTDTKIALFARKIAEMRTVSAALCLISDELDGVRVTLTHNGLTLASVGDHVDGDSLVDVEIRGVDSSAVLTSSASTRLNLELIRAILEVAAPTVQAALLLESAQDDADAASTGVIPNMNLVIPGRTQKLEVALQRTLANLGWLSDAYHVAVWILGDGPSEHRAEMTALVRLLWRRIIPDAALAEVDDGWLSIAMFSSKEAAKGLPQSIIDKMGGSLAELGLSMGVSRSRAEPSRLVTSVREARLAAIHARWKSGHGTIELFKVLGVEVAASLVDGDDALLVAELTLPQLLAAHDRDQVLRAVSKFLDHKGAVIPAARSLGLHRNTLQVRLNRARELGIDLDDPASLLSIHMLVDALHRRLTQDADKRID